MQAKLHSVNALAVELRRDRRTLARDLETLKPAKVQTQGGRTLRWYYLADVIGHLYLPLAASADGDEYEDQRQRLAAAQAEKIERENAVTRGDLSRREDVVKFWTDCIGNARQKLLQLPSRLRAELPPTPTPVQAFDLARRLVHEALTDLAEYEPPQQ